MLKTLSLILPVLIPSWRFFKSIEPSPRVQWALFAAADGQAETWQDFRPKPQSTSFAEVVLRLFWSPARNDTLFVVACAERIEQAPTAHSIAEIDQRILGDLDRSGANLRGKLMQFRLIFVHREGGEMYQDIVFVSDAIPAQQAQS